MEQSIATSQGNVRPGKQALRNLTAIFTRLWSGFAPIIPNSRHPSSTDVPANLDIERISARLAIESRAESDGRNGQPPSTEEGISGTQTEIVVHFKNLQRSAQHQITGFAKRLREFGEEIDLLGVNGSLRDIPSRCENEVLRLIAESQSELNYLEERETKQQKHYEALHDKSNQGQVADRPLSPVFHMVFVAFLIGVGAFAIAKYSVPGFVATGLVPPSWAILIVTIVALVSTAIARAVSHTASRAGRLTGWLGSIALIGMMAFLAAHYIAAVTANPGVTVRNVVDSILANPIAIVTDVADWKVFVIVITAGLLASLVGYRPDSTYGGYGDAQGAIYSTRKKRDRLTKRLRMQINALIDEADVEATDLPKRLKSKISQYSRLVDESKRIPASMSDYDVALEDGCNILLDRYRAANTNARHTEIPMSFSEHICFRPEHDPNVSIFENEEGRLEDLQQGIVELEGEAAQVRQKLRDLNSRAINALEDTPAPV